VQLYDQEQQTFTPLLTAGFSAEEEQIWVANHTFRAEAEDEYEAGITTRLLEGHAILVNLDEYRRYPRQHTSSDTPLLAAPITYSAHLLGALILEPADSNHRFTIWDMAIIEGIAQIAGLAIEQAWWQQEARTARINEATMRASNEQKDEFLAFTSHEFRTPLTIILAHSQLMARALKKANAHEATGRLHESIGIIQAQAHQLDNIVNTFLEVAHLNEGKIVLALEPVDLAEVAQEAVRTQSATTTKHSLHCKVEPQPRPYQVHADRARLAQIFANLLQNAIKYSPFGGAITVSLRQCPDYKGRPFVEVWVEDRGIGVPREAQPRLFERFYRAPNIGGSKAGGFGLGLYMVAEFLRLQGGAIRVESSGIYGEGSRFIFTLPLMESGQKELEGEF
jgi:signal transduction histidine kinase